MDNKNKHIKFKKTYIEITNVCNLSCSFCPPTKRNPDFMTIKDFSKILDEIKFYSSYLYFHVKGEPLLHPDVGQFLNLCHKKGFKVNLTTNGTLISHRKELLLGSPALRQVSFSLQSYEEHSDSAKREKYINDILDFTKEAVKDTDLIIEFRLWNLESKTICQSKKNEYFLDVIGKSLNLPYKIEEKINPGKGVKLTEEIYLSQSYEFAWPDLTREIISERGFCYGLRNQIAILVDGTVVPCCLDSEGEINLGNIYETHFKEIIESKRAEAIIKGFSDRKTVEPLCQRCGYRIRFD